MRGTGDPLNLHTHRREGKRALESPEGKVKQGERGVFVRPRHEEMTHNMLLTL